MSLQTQLFPANIAGFRRKTTLATYFAYSRLPIAASLLASSVLTHAANLDIVSDGDRRLQEGHSLDIELRVSVSPNDRIGRGDQCTVTGQLAGRSPTNDPKLQASDYAFSSTFSINFTGVEAYGGVRTAVAAPTALLPSEIVQLSATDDKIVEQDEILQIYIEPGSVQVNCISGEGYGGQYGGEYGGEYGGAYGGSVDMVVQSEAYGPLIIIEDKSFDTVGQSKLLLPQIESIAVLTVSGAQARNKTLARQLNSARTEATPRNRVSMKLDGTALPEFGGSAGDDAFSPWGVFLTGDFELGDRTLDQNNAFDFKTNTVVAGVDYKAGENWVFGGAISRSNANAEIKNKIDETKLDQNALSVFASFYTASCYLDVIASQGANDYDLLRSIGADRAIATTDGDETSLGLGTGYNVDFTGSTLKLFTRVDYIKATVEGYTERGEGALVPVTLNDFELKSFTANLGAGWSWVINTSFGVLTPEVGVDFEHQFEGDGFNVDGQFVGGGEPGKFEISTYQKDANYMNGNLALNAVFANGFSSFVSYTGQWGRDDWSSDHYALGARLEF